MPNRAFEEVVLPHLDAAFNYARWLTKSDADAEDVVQDAAVRALRYFSSLRNDDARAWLLTIVRNTYYTWIRRNRLTETIDQFDNEEHILISDALDPERALLQEADKQMVRRALRKLPAQFLEVIVLREFEELSYQQIAEVVQVPLGTVMSRLARARKRLGQLISTSCLEATAEEIAV